MRGSLILWNPLLIHKYLYEKPQCDEQKNKSLVWWPKAINLRKWKFAWKGNMVPEGLHSDNQVFGIGGSICNLRGSCRAARGSCQSVTILAKFATWNFEVLIVTPREAFWYTIDNLRLLWRQTPFFALVYTTIQIDTKVHMRSGVYFLRACLTKGTSILSDQRRSSFDSKI